MDPNEALLQLTVWAVATVDDESEPPWSREAAECFVGLSEWLSKGGFLPNEWNKGR